MSLCYFVPRFQTLWKLVAVIYYDQLKFLQWSGYLAQIITMINDDHSMINNNDWHWTIKGKKISRIFFRTNFSRRKNNNFLTGFFLTTKACSLLSDAPKNSFWECLSREGYTKQTSDPTLRHRLKLPSSYNSFFLYSIQKVGFKISIIGEILNF